MYSDVQPRPWWGQDWILPKKIILAIFGTSLLLLLIGIILLAVGLSSAGGVLTGLGGCGMMIILLLGLHAYCCRYTKDVYTQTGVQTVTDEIPNYAVIQKPSSLKRSDSGSKRNGRTLEKHVTLAPDTETRERSGQVTVAPSNDGRIEGVNIPIQHSQIHSQPANYAHQQPIYKPSGHVYASPSPMVRPSGQAFVIQQQQPQYPMQVYPLRTASSTSSSIRYGFDDDYDNPAETTPMLNQHGGLQSHHGTIQTGGIQSGGMQSGGIQSGGIQSGGIQSGGIQSGGIQSGGIQGGVIKSGELHGGGIQSGGIQGGGLQTGGIHSAGVQGGGVQGGSSSSSFNNQFRSSSSSTSSSQQTTIKCKGGGGSGSSGVVGGGGGGVESRGGVYSIGGGGGGSGSGMYSVREERGGGDSGVYSVGGGNRGGGVYSASTGGSSSSYSVSGSGGGVRSQDFDIPEPAPLVYPSAKRPMTFEQTSSSKMSVYDNMASAYPESGAA